MKLTSVKLYVKTAALLKQSVRLCTLLKRRNKSGYTWTSCNLFIGGRNVPPLSSFFKHRIWKLLIFHLAHSTFLYLFCTLDYGGICMKFLNTVYVKQVITEDSKQHIYDNIIADKDRLDSLD